ncbi:tail collar fiber protein [Salmonella phage vB_SnwM_CGG4-1]|uniref:Short tail fiber n=1 Tax=Salmonella phage vB_SnwM_CGG4-1 TaxID=1815631 RepID=A0A1B0VVC7_9CAUD|nr:tail collar fiber protein [Salmonella phage vB_SnwM_CGG4-1]ANA49499.1 short tail fiber [Salmonella phage vB_SnwM_CGG4-1]
MQNNTLKHISDESKYVTFDPAGSGFNQTITNVQDALSAISADGITGVPLATETVAGKARIATQLEVDAGVSTDTIITPATLSYKLQRPEASTTVLGVTQYATDEEAIAGIATNRTIVASSLKATIDNVFTVRVATESANGVMKISSTPAAQAGVDDTTAMTPLKTKQAIAAATALIPAWGPATESEQGVVRLATLPQLRDPGIRDGYSVSPFTLNQWQATESNLGAIKLSNAGQMDAGNDHTTAVTPWRFASTRATTGRAGTTILSNDLNGDGSKALSANSAVLPSNRAAVSAGVYEHDTAADNKYMTRNNLKSYLPVGTMTLAAYNYDTGNCLKCNGRWLNRHQWPELFAVIGFTYGGDWGDNFAIPDMRGLVPRGFDDGRGLDPGRGFGSYQEDTMQRITAGWTMDDQAVTSNYPPSGACEARDYGSVNYDAGSDDRRWRGFRMYFDSARQTRVSHETRQKNLALNYVIVAR